jgi:hypothetical protein
VKLNPRFRELQDHIWRSIQEEAARAAVAA